MRDIKKIKIGGKEYEIPEELLEKHMVEAQPLTDQEKVGHILRSMRKSNSISLKNASIAIGFKSPNQLSMVEAGKSKAPLDKISDFPNGYNADAVIRDMLLYSNHKKVWYLHLSMNQVEYGIETGEADQKIERLIKKLSPHIDNGDKIQEILRTRKPGDEKYAKETEEE